MTENAPALTSDEPLFALVTFLVASARGAPEEGAQTASLRLIEAAGRLATIASNLTGDRFLAELGEEIVRDCSTRYLGSVETYLDFLDQQLETVAREVRRRNDLPTGQHVTTPQSRDRPS